MSCFNLGDVEETETLDEPDADEDPDQFNLGDDEETVTPDEPDTDEDPDQ